MGSLLAYLKGLALCVAVRYHNAMQASFWYAWSLLRTGLGENESDYPKRHHAKWVLWGGSAPKPSVIWPLGRFYLHNNAIHKDAKLSASR